MHPPLDVLVAAAIDTLEGDDLDRFAREKGIEMFPWFNPSVELKMLIGRFETAGFKVNITGRSIVLLDLDVYPGDTWSDSPLKSSHRAHVNECLKRAMIKGLLRDKENRLI
jgi:hypothetical protein